MDGAAVVGSGIPQVSLRDAETAQLMERLERLLREAAEVEVERTVRLSACPIIP